jgi:hypothetical protein
VEFDFKTSLFKDGRLISSFNIVVNIFLNIFKQLLIFSEFLICKQFITIFRPKKPLFRPDSTSASAESSTSADTPRPNRFTSKRSTWAKPRLVRSSPASSTSFRWRRCRTGWWSCSATSSPASSRASSRAEWSSARPGMNPKRKLSRCWRRKEANPEIRLIFFVCLF